MKRLSILFAALLVFPFDSVAQNIEAVSVVIGGNAYRATMLGDITAKKTLEMDEFATIVADRLQQFTSAEKTEACAAICRAETGEWGASPLSIGSHLVCPIIAKCPDGMVATGEHIHSHPRSGSYVVNLADKIVLRQRLYTVGSTAKTGNTRVFSSEDFSGGPGYMVTASGRLFHQSGPHAVREVHPEAHMVATQ